MPNKHQADAVELKNKQRSSSQGTFSFFTSPCLVDLWLGLPPRTVPYQEVDHQMDQGQRRDPLRRVPASGGGDGNCAIPVGIFCQSAPEVISADMGVRSYLLNAYGLLGKSDQ